MAPHMIDFQFKLATAYDPSNAKSTIQYNKILILNPLHEKALTNLGYKELNAQNYLMAEKHFLSALGQNPDYVLNVENLARCYLEQGQFKKAKLLLLRLQNQSPNEERYKKILKTIP